jgi:hypothetical protein
MDSLDVHRIPERVAQVGLGFDTLENPLMDGRVAPGLDFMVLG